LASSCTVLYVLYTSQAKFLVLHSWFQIPDELGLNPLEEPLQSFRLWCEWPYLRELHQALEFPFVTMGGELNFPKDIYCLHQMR